MNNEPKFFESDNGIISFQVVKPTVSGIEQTKELLIIVESPFTKRKDMVMIFNIEDGLDIVNEIKKQLRTTKI